MTVLVLKDMFVNSAIKLSSSIQEKNKLLKVIDEEVAVCQIPDKLHVAVVCT